jgi:hypothetical protein
VQKRKPKSWAKCTKIPKKLGIFSFFCTKWIILHWK